MSSIKKNKRISLSLSEEELNLWEAANTRDTLSAFIRHAVNEYIKIVEPSKTQSLFDIILDQRAQFSEIQNKLTRLEKIEGELIDLTAAMAKFDIITPILNDGQISWETKEPKK